MNTQLLHTLSRKYCLATKNNKSIDQCPKQPHGGNDFCGVHKRAKEITLADGSLWQNKKKSALLKDCSLLAEAPLFWHILQKEPLEELNKTYRPPTVSSFRQNKVKHVQKELERLRAGKLLKKQKKKERLWFLNLLYYLGNRQEKVRTIQRFYRGPIRRYLTRRRRAAKRILNNYRRRKFWRLLSHMAPKARTLRMNNCVNDTDPITQEHFMEVPLERWVICQGKDEKEEKQSGKSWWFDVASAIQLLGSPGSHSGENPFTRQEFPSEFILEADEKGQTLKNRFSDIGSLYEEKRSTEVSSCFILRRYQNAVKLTKLLETFKEYGYYFPKQIFDRFNLYELKDIIQQLASKWILYPATERQRLCPRTNGHLFPPTLLNSIPSITTISLLRKSVLDAALQLALYQSKYIDRTTGVLTLLDLFAGVNVAAYQALHPYVCDCSEAHSPVVAIPALVVEEQAP